MNDMEILFHTPGAAEMAFPYHVVAAGRTLTRRQAAPVVRRYHQHVLILTLEGAGMIRTGGRRRQAAPGTLTWLDTARDYSHACDPSARHWRYLWLGVQGMGLDQLFDQTGAAIDPVTPTANPAALTFAMQAVLQRMRDRTAQTASANSATVAQVLATLLADRDALPGNTEPGQGRGVDQAIVALRLALAQRWTVPDIATLAGVSPSQLHRAFRTRTGLSPMAWLRRERVNVAKPLLLDRSLRIQTVAEAVGYIDPFHFSRDFRTLVGRSPRSFRNADGA